MDIVFIPTVDSTHTLLSRNHDAVPPMTMLCAREQTAGRGQRGNSWEAEPGQNLTFSMHFEPKDVKPAEQFVISEAFALAFIDLLHDSGIEATVKWPNDIYVGDRKICGILIEHSIMGTRISRTLLSAGLNVNQRRFHSAAPNPISIANILGGDLVPEVIAKKLAKTIDHRLASLDTEDKRKALHEEFMQRLYRGDNNFYPFTDNLRGETISARITDVAPDGVLSLQPADGGPVRRFLFKEVSFVLPRIPSDKP